MPAVQRHTQIRSDDIKSISAADVDRVFSPHALSSAQLGTIMAGTTDALAKVGPHAFGSYHMGTIIGGTIDADTKIAGHAFGSAQLGTIIGGTIDADTKIAPHAFGSAQMGTIIGGTIDADTKITPHSFGSAEMGTIMPTESETERMIAPKTIDRDALSYLTQSGSVQLGTTREVVFPISFADTPSVVLTPLGSIDMTAYEGVEGSATWGIHDVVSGSFQAYATPTQYFMYVAQGSA